MAETLQANKEITKDLIITPGKIMTKVMACFDEVKRKEPRVDLDMAQTVLAKPFTLKTTIHSENGLDRRVNVLANKEKTIVITQERTINNNNEIEGTRYSILKRKDGDSHNFIKLQCTEENELHIIDTIVSGKSGSTENFTIGELLSISQFIELQNLALPLGSWSRG